MVSKNVQHLREHGPSPLEEMPNNCISVKDKQDGVWRFKPTRDPDWIESAWESSVYYLEGEHTLIETLQSFVELNSPVKISGRGAVKKLTGHFEGSEGADDLSRVSGYLEQHSEVVIEARGFASGTTASVGNSRGRPCPKCGEEISSTKYPQHVRRCSGPSDGTETEGEAA